MKDREATFYNSIPGARSYQVVEAQLKDLWLYDYSLREGDTVVDVGAGIGDEAIVFSRLVGPKGRVVAIEAHPGTFRCLQKTIRANRLDNVIPMNYAVSDKEEEIRISDGDVHMQNATGVAEGISVSAKTLDALLLIAGVQSADLIKMNIEGAETAALRGSPEALANTKHWVVSCHDFIGACTHAEVSDILRSHGLSMLPSRQDSREPVPFYVYARRS